ncbi:EipB family protein [Roseococcus sp. YIM B11640]|uniref:EipB family protein n=1 Tax=Roseococcus sp. YIM B11640 TaxID=3133973 RepID=UPI003C797827
MKFRTALAALLSAALLSPALAANEPGTEHMLAHRAAYRLTLDSVRDSASVTRAEGIMLFEVVDACDAWASRQRFTLVLSDRDGNTIETSSDYATLESKDGTRLRFSLTQMTEGAVTSRIAGEATLTPEGGRVQYSEPSGEAEDLPRGTILPMVHTLRSLAAARAGQRILATPLFDGTSAEGAQDTTTFFSGGWTQPQPNPNFPLLATLGSARMRIAFFDRNASSQANGASTPDYEVSMRYFENGVADELKMDFGEFVVDGRLGELQPIPSPCS